MKTSNKYLAKNSISPQQKYIAFKDVYSYVKVNIITQFTF